MTRAIAADYDSALDHILSFQGDPLSDLERIVVVQPDFLMAHLLEALILGLSTDRSVLSGAHAALDRARRVEGASARERQHVRAVEAWLGARFSDACAVWESLLIERPDDAVALFFAHQADFLLGHISELRDRVARRLPDIEPGSALEGYYLGMYAFGLEEMGDYAAALVAGQRALERNPSDAWAIHAVAHVYEMTNQLEVGEQWLLNHAEGWRRSNLAVHLAWHQALLHYDAQRWEVVLELYDRVVRRPQSLLIMELVDASSLLWRLYLADVDVGDRWQSLADAWEPHLDEAWYAFNDMHAMMAFAGARRFDLAERLLAVLRAPVRGHGENEAVIREIGLPVAEALLAYAEARYTVAVTGLETILTRAVAAGGSHAQRDVLALTLLAAAQKGGNLALARALLNQRLGLRPGSPLNQRWNDRVRASA